MRTINKITTILAVCAVNTSFAAANFSFAPVGTLPTTIAPGQTVTATFRVTNMNVSAALYGYTIQGLPANVTQDTQGAQSCGNPINLDASTSCNLVLKITAPVTIRDIAICHGNSCTTALLPLQVTASTTPIGPTAKYAYIAKSNPGVVDVCSVNDTTGALSGCVDATQGGFSFTNGISGIVVNSSTNRAYLTAASGADAYQCSIDPTTGFFTTCQNSTLQNYGATTGMVTLNNDASYAFIVNNNVGAPGYDVMACPITAGTMSAVCTATNAQLIDPSAAGIVFNADSTVAYIANNNGNSVVSCAVTGTTQLNTNCVAHTDGGSFANPIDVAYHPSGNIYVTDEDIDVISACDATFTTCNDVTPTPSISNPWGITLNNLGTIAYVTDNLSSGNVYVCSVNLGSGVLFGCTNTPVSDYPVKVALYYQ